MRILVSGFTTNYGGVETFLMNYYRAMKKIDENLIFDVISTSNQPAFKDKIIAMGGKVHLISRPRARAKVKKELAKIMTENKYDVFWCNKCDLSDITFLQEAYKHNIPMRIIHSHSSSNMFTGIRRKLVQITHSINKLKIEKYATDFWSCSDYAANWLFTNKIANSKSKFIPNSIDSKKFQFNEEIRSDYRKQLNVDNSVVIGVVGAFLYAKNPEFIIDIFKEIHNSKPNAVLIWAGTGELMEHIQAKVKEYKFEQAVQFLGMRRDVDKLMQAMDCLLLPSKFEGLPVVAVEAQAAGLTVFASSEGISKQTKITKQFHFLSLSQSPKQWAEKILSTDLKHKDTYEQIKKSGFDINVSAEKIFKEFQVK